MSTGISVGIIGTGIAAATIAERLSGYGCRVELLEKSRGVGGRMVSRYTETHVHDHGAQFFTARTPAFQQTLQRHEAAVAAWDARVTTLSPTGKPYKRDWFETHYVGTPRMNALCKSMIGDLTIHLGDRVEQVNAEPGSVTVITEQGHARQYDWVISTAPAEQTLALLPAPLDDVIYEPCFALLGTLSTPPNFDAAVVKDSIISWLGVSSSKPGRNSHPTLIVHSTGDYASAEFDTDPLRVNEQMNAELVALGIGPLQDSNLHRWRYARVRQAWRAPFWIHETLPLAACGDWGIGGRVEDAFTSACLLSDELLRRLPQARIGQ